jgi:hypothetical protein
VRARPREGRRGVNADIVIISDGLSDDGR